MSYECSKNLLKLIREDTPYGRAVRYARCLHYGIPNNAIARAGDENVIDSVLWGEAFGRLSRIEPSHYRGL